MYMQWGTWNSQKWKDGSCVHHWYTPLRLSFSLTSFKQTETKIFPSLPLDPCIWSSHVAIFIPHFLPLIWPKRNQDTEKRTISYIKREREGGGKEIKNYETVQSLYFTTPVKSFVEFHVGRRTFSLSKWFIVIYTNHQRACKPKANWSINLKIKTWENIIKY